MRRFLPERLDPGCETAFRGAAAYSRLIGMIFVRPLFAATLLLFASIGVARADELFDACAANAASTFEPGYEGVGFADASSFSAYDAIEACRVALEADSANIRLMAWLGIAYVADQQPRKAVPLLEQAAAAGNVVAQRALGDLLILGKGVAQDKPKGVSLLRAADAQGFAPAALSLGYCYEFGDGVPADLAVAMEWYLKAADADVVRAQMIVARQYQRGLGVPADAAAALGWLERAADVSGDPEAQYLLGVALLEGQRGAAPDVAAALAQFQRSAETYNPLGSTALGYMTELGIGLEANATEAVQLYMNGRIGNIATAKHNLARLEETGEGISAAPEEARELYESAARGGEMRAAVNLALMQLQGSGGPQDIDSAFRWTSKAATSGNAAGLNNLGRLYELGLGVAADSGEARRLYGEAAALGYTIAAGNLARLGN